MAHELTHGVERSRDTLATRYVDRGHGGEPLVSYTIGSIAQCSFLKLKEPNARSWTEQQFQRCVDRVGTDRFVAYCDEDAAEELAEE
jgi:hypothetical protein